jgi:large subunit ribosomal protein L20
MSRVKRGKTHIKKRRKLLKKAKGYKWGRKKSIKLAKTAVTKAGVHAYRDRRRKKRTNRQLWQVKINAACRQHGLSYSKFIAGLKKAKIEIDRKILADLAENEPKIFEKIIEEIKKN